MEKIDKFIVKALYYACSILMFFMAAIITAQVLSRYIAGNPLTWSEELGRYIFVWMSFLGMAVAIRHGSHVALDILVTVLIPPGLGRDMSQVTWPDYRYRHDSSG